MVTAAARLLWFGYTFEQEQLVKLLRNVMKRCPTCNQEVLTHGKCQVTSCQNDATLEGWHKVSPDLMRVLRVCDDHVSELIGGLTYGKDDS
jgi:hypothetical protein